MADDPTNNPPTDPPADPPQDPADPPADDDVDDVVAQADKPDAVKKAIQAERERAKTEKQRADSLQAQLDKLRQDAMSDTEKAIEQARKEAAEQVRTELTQSANERLFRAEVKAASAGKVVDQDLLSDPLVAQRILKFDDIPTTEDGDIDSEAISKAIETLLETKPHLAVSATRTPGSADQGARPAGTPPPPSSLEDAFAAHYTGG
jgi:hypothetical protein